jgi:hypothetical protein
MSRRLSVKILGILLVLLMAATSVLAAVIIDSDGQVPFYARAPRDGIINDGEWARRTASNIGKTGRGSISRR